MAVKRTYTREDLKKLDYLSKEQLINYVPWRTTIATQIINAGFFPELTNPLLKEKKGGRKYYRRVAVEKILIEMEDTGYANFKEEKEV